MISSKTFHSNSIFGLIVSILIVFFYLSIYYPYDFFLGTSSYWSNQTEDITQYIAGFNYYFSEPWTFPLLNISSINFPEGTRATFVDIIPFYSLILKIFIPKNLYPFNPFGIWIFLSYILLGVASWLITKSLNIKSISALIVLVTFSITLPTLSMRLGHISLMSHWLILFAFLLYIKSFSESRQYVRWSMLLFISFYINIYIFSMVFSIFIVTIITNFSIRTFKTSICEFFIPLSILLCSLFIMILPLKGSTIAQDSGWGYYSMNLLSPFLGGKIIDIKSSIMSGQYEGFNYLGLGLIILVGYSLYLKNLNKVILTKHVYLFVLLILFFVYSLSYKVFFGTSEIANLAYPDFLKSLFIQFRASGRFFWPIAYSLIIFSVYFVYKYERKHAIFFIFILIIQLYDISDINRKLFEKASRGANNIISFPEIKSLINENTNINFYPKFRCSKSSSPYDTLLPIMLYASENGIKLNTGYIARYEPNCEDIGDELTKSNKDTTTYIFVKDEFPIIGLVKSFFKTDYNIGCQEYNKFIICSKFNEHKLFEEIIVDKKYFRTTNGIFNFKGLKSDKKGGYLLFGPYHTLVSGNYKINLVGTVNQSKGSFFEIVSDKGKNYHAKTIIPELKIENNDILSVNFYLDRDYNDIEFRVYINSESELEISSIKINKQ